MASLPEKDRRATTPKLQCGLKNAVEDTQKCSRGTKNVAEEPNENIQKSNRGYLLKTTWDQTGCGEPNGNCVGR